MVGELIGAIGLAVAIGREAIAARERRRARPVVVVHEDRGRHFRDGMGQAVRVFLTNESAATAFNVRFGVEMHDTPIPYRYRDDADASRQNVLAPGKRLPEEGTFEIVLPDELAWAGEGDPDPGRVYWASYQSPSGDWWATRNPAERAADFEVRRIRRIKRHREREAGHRRRQLAQGDETYAKARDELTAANSQENK